MSHYPLPHRLLFCAVLFLFSITSCTLMHDDLENCPSGVQVKLEVAMDVNVEYGDHYKKLNFVSDLENLTLWVFDENGTYVSLFKERGAILKQNENIMTLPIPPGKYQMLVWAGTDNDKFDATEMTPGVSKIEELTMRLARDANNRQAAKLPSIWHGSIKEAVVKEYEYTHLTVELTKNTKTVTVVLNDQSGTQDLYDEDYSFEIIAANGFMDYENNLLPDDNICYDAYLIETADVSVIDEDGNDNDTKLTVARAELNTLRLMTDKLTRFVVTNKKTGKKILNINLTEYLLLTRDKYTGSDGRELSPQAYLNYEDMFRIVFFLSGNPGGSPDPGDDEPLYLVTKLTINGWTVRINNIDM